MPKRTLRLRPDGWRGDLLPDEPGYRADAVQSRTWVFKG